jgi:histidine ammonia-lyase
MGANAAVKCFTVIENVEKVLAIELLNAAQALDLRRPGKSSNAIEKTHASFRKLVPFTDKDEVLHELMKNSVHFIRHNQA